MSEFRIATRYAKSLLGLADERGVLEEVHNDMQLFSKVCRENGEFVRILKNPIIRHDKKLNILKEIFGGKVNDLTTAIFDIISRKNREAILPSIAREFHNQYNVFKHVQAATVVTTFPLTDDLRQEFKNIVKEITNSDAELHEEVDESILGGFVLKLGDRQIDDSIHGKLKDLKHKFSYNPYIREI